MRRLFADYWKPLTSLVAGVPVLLTILNKIGLPIGTWSDPRIGPTAQWILFGLGIAILIVIRFPGVAYFITRLVSPPSRPIVDRPRVFRGPLRYEAEDAGVFFGRSADAETCSERIARKPLFVLEGESGSGKSSLLEAVLLPKADARFRVVACRCGEDPFGKLRAKLLDEPYKPGRNYGKPKLLEAIDQAGTRADEASKPLLVCIDQFEELFVTVKDDVRRKFLDALGEAVAEGKLRLVVAIRKDFSDLLRDLRIVVDPENRAFAFDRESYHVLRPFSIPQAEEVLGRMMDRDEVHRGDTLRRRELDDFAGALVRELSRPPLDARLSRDDEPCVLPVELQMVGWTYETLLGGRFSAADLRRRGGKVGLYRDYIEDAKEYVRGKTGVPDATSLTILIRLISPARTGWPQSVKAIAPGTGLTHRQIDSVLQALAQRYLVRLLPDPAQETDTVPLPARRYELMHEHLVNLLAEAPDPALQRVRDAEDRLRFWIERTRPIFTPLATRSTENDTARHRLTARLGSVYAQPIPIGETLRLWRHARDRDARHTLRRNFLGFGARIFTLVLLVALPIGGWWLRETSNHYQVEYVIARAPIEFANTDPIDELSWQAIGEWLTALVESNHIDDATKAVDGRVKLSDSQARAYTLIAGAAARAGRLDDAMNAAERVKDQYEQAQAYSVVAEEAARAGRLDDAMNAAERISDPVHQARAYAAIAEAAAKAGLTRAAAALDGAMKAAERVKDPDIRSRTYESVAEAAAKAGRLGDAMNAAERVADPDRRSRTYASVTEAAAKAGRLGDAMNAAERIADPGGRTSEYMSIAEEAVKAGRLDVAMNAAEKVTGYSQVVLYESVAGAAARAGRLDDAMNAAERVAAPFNQVRAYAAIAEAAARAGLPRATAALDEAIKAAEKTEEGSLIQAYMLVAGAAAQAGRLDEAVKAAERVKDPYTRSWAYASVAEAAARAGLPRAAAAAIDEAMKTAEKIERGYRYQTYMSIAESAAKAGRLDDAMNAAERIKDPSMRSQAYVAIAGAATEAGRLDEAMNAAEKAAANLTRIPVLTSIAEAAARTGRLDKAMKAAERVEVLYQAPVYASIAEAATKAGRLDDLMKMADEVADPYAQAQAYASVAEAASKAGQPRAAAALVEAMKAAERVKDLDMRSSTYASIAEAATKAGRLDDAMNAAARVTNPGYHSRAYESIAGAAAKAGRLDDAMNAAGRIPMLGDQARAYASIAQTATEAGRLDNAVNAAEKVAEPDPQAQSYASIAEAAARAGNIFFAKKALDRISKEHERPRSRALAAVALRLARQNRLYEARITSSECGPVEKLRVYAAILRAASKKDRWAQ